MTPADEVRAELEAALARDTTRLGYVFLRKREGWTNAQIAESVGASSHGFITNYNGSIAAILDGRIPEGATLRRNTKGTVDSFTRRHRAELAVSTRHWLAYVSGELARRGAQRTDRDERPWVNGASVDHIESWQTVKISQSVHDELVRRRRATEPAIDDVLRRLLGLDRADGFRSAKD